MTSPEDDGLEDALRRALSEAARQVEPSPDGLDKIRTQIGDRSPRPWLLSVLAGLVDRVRYWTWHGHWTWQESLPRLGALREWRSRRGNFPEWDVRWLRLMTVFAGATVIVGIVLGVQPVRHAILEASTTLNGQGGPAHGSAGPEGSGTQADGGSGTMTGAATPVGGATPSGGLAGQEGTSPSPSRSQTPAAHATASTRCVTSTPPASAGAEPTPAGVTPEASGTSAAAGAIPGNEVLSPLTASSATPTKQATHTSTNRATCPVTPPTKTPTAMPTPASSSLASVPAPSDVTPTQPLQPTRPVSSQLQTSTSTSTSTASASASPSTSASTRASTRASARASTRAPSGSTLTSTRPSPSGSPSQTGPGGRGTRHAGSRGGHPRQR